MSPTHTVATTSKALDFGCRDVAYFKILLQESYLRNEATFYILTTFFGAHMWPILEAEETSWRMGYNVNYVYVFTHDSMPVKKILAW